MASFEEHRKVYSGNRIEIKLAGEVVGLLQDLTASDSYDPEMASGIGDIHATEYVPTVARHQLQCSVMVLFEAQLRSVGVSWENGDDALQGKVFDIEIFGKNSEPGSPDPAGLLRKYQKCTFEGGDVQVRKHAIVVNSARFLALDVAGKVL